MILIDYNGTPVLLRYKREIDEYLEKWFKCFNEYTYILEFVERAIKEPYFIKSDFSAEGIELTVICLPENNLDFLTCSFKKLNVEYWDKIDTKILELIEYIVACSYAKQDFDKTEDGKADVESAAYAAGLIGEIRDIIIGFSKAHGGYYPYIPEEF